MTDEGDASKQDDFWELTFDAVVRPRKKLMLATRIRLLSVVKGVRDASCACTKCVSQGQRSRIDPEEIHGLRKHVAPSEASAKWFSRNINHPSDESPDGHHVSAKKSLEDRR